MILYDKRLNCGRVPWNELGFLQVPFSSTSSRGISRVPTNIYECRGGSRALATSKMERFVIIVNSFQLLTIITKRSILDLQQS